MWLLSLCFWLPLAHSQKITSTSVVVLPTSDNYQSKSYFVNDHMLLSSITGIEALAVGFDFNYISKVADIDRQSSSCTISTKIIRNNVTFALMVIRYVQLSQSMNVRLLTVNVTGSAGSITLEPVGWLGTTKVVSMLQGWSGATGTLFANFALNGLEIQMSSNISRGWLVYQLWIYRSEDFEKFEAETNQMNINKAKSQLFGIKKVQPPSTVIIDCSVETGCNVNSINASYVILASGEPQTMYSPSAQKAEEPNWVLISMLSLSSLIFLLLMVPTIKYAREHFCPQVMSNRVRPTEENQQAEVTDAKIHVGKGLELELVERPDNFEELDIKCCICLDKTAHCQLHPCGHRQFCLSCVAYMEKRGYDCPVCRAPIDKVSCFSL